MRAKLLKSIGDRPWGGWLGRRSRAWQAFFSRPPPFRSPPLREAPPRPLPAPKLNSSTSRTAPSSAQKRRFISACMGWASRRPERNEPNSGHHHLLIDTDLPPLDSRFPTTRTICTSAAARRKSNSRCRPDRIRCSCLLGDADHIPHTPPIYSDKIHVTVAESAPAPARGGASLAARNPPSLACGSARLYRLS